jgi:hypothetical protein
MTNPTTPFSWQMPTSTDLVTDLPADFETFGQAVATSMADLLGGTTGQVLSKASNTDMDFTWVTSDDANAIQNTIVDAKGDLIGATAADTPARLAVGSNGQLLTADSSAATGLSYQNNFAAGKNKIINGDFGVWQRGTSFTNNASGAYNCDRFKQFFDGSGATRIISQQTFTPGTAPAAPYESQYFLRFNQSVAGTLGTFNTLTQPIEDVRTFAGNTVTLSYYAKAAATLSLTIEADQGFGSGGSTTVTTSVVAGQTITTSWVRYSHTFTLPSVSGKTIGTGSFVNLSFKLPLNTTFTFDTWGWQLEQGSTATAFQTATGTIQGELAACQRYYYQNATAIQDIMNGAATSNVQGRYSFCFPTQMRIAPTSLVTQNLSNSLNRTGGVATGGTFSIGSATPLTLEILYVHGSAAWTAGDTLLLYGNNANSYYGWSAEL